MKNLRILSLVIAVALVLSTSIPIFAAQALAPASGSPAWDAKYKAAKTLIATESLRTNASGNKITSNTHSSDFPGLYFYWDDKQKDDGILLVEPGFFNLFKDNKFILTAKNANLYWDYTVAPDSAYMISGVYAYRIPRSFVYIDKKGKEAKEELKNINMVFIDGDYKDASLLMQEALKAAIDDAETLLYSVWISVDGSDIPVNSAYTDVVTWTAYDAAISAAKSAADSTGGSLATFGTAKNTLAAATASFSSSLKTSSSGFNTDDGAIFESTFSLFIDKAHDFMWSTRPSETGKLVFDGEYWIEPDLLYWLAECYSEGYDLKAGWGNPAYTQADRITAYFDLVRSTAIVDAKRSAGEDIIPHALPPYTPAPPIVTLQQAGIPTPDPTRTETITFSGPTAASGAATITLLYTSEYNNGASSIPITIEFTSLSGLEAEDVAAQIVDALMNTSAFTAIGWTVSASGSDVILTWAYPGNRGAQDHIVLEVLDDGGTGIEILNQVSLLAGHTTIWTEGSEGVLTINRPLVTNNTIWIGEYRFGGKRYTFGQGGFTGADEYAQADALFALLTNGENTALNGYSIDHAPGSNTISFSAIHADEPPPWFIYTIRNFSTYSSWERGDKQRPLMSWALYPRIDLNESRYWFEVHKLPHDVYAFFEPGDNDQEVMSFLIIGDGKAMLLDTGEGVGDLKKAVEELIVEENLSFTIDDVFVTITHGHGDHIGSVGQFDGKDIYCHPDAAGSVERGVGSKTTGGTGYGWDVPGGQARLNLPGAAVTHTVVEGDTIDVGGRILDVIVTPDHTTDSISLIDRENGIIFTGDWYYAGWGFTSGSCGYVYEAEYTRVYEMLGEMLENGEVGENVEDFWIFGQHNELMYGRQIFMDNAIAWRYIINGEGPKFAIGTPRNYRFFNGGLFYGPRNMTSAQFPGNVPALHQAGEGPDRCISYFH